MNISKAGVIAMAALTFLALYPQKGLAQTFTSEEFLEWSYGDQEGYLAASVMMVGVVASQLDRTQAQCIDKWYAGEEKAEHQTLLTAMREHSSYHPQAIVLWVVQNECGKITGDGG